MDLLDHPLKHLIKMTAKRAPELGGSTAALLSSMLGLAMCKMALLISEDKNAGNDLTVARLDAISMNIASIIEDDRASVTTLLETMSRDGSDDERRSALIEATRHPLAASHVLVDALELLDRNAASVDHSVGSDFYGGAAIVGAGFKAVSMAINANLQHGLLKDMSMRTESGRSQLIKRQQNACRRLEAHAQSQAIPPKDRL